MTSRSRKPSRFSLLLLEDNEVLLSDLAVLYRFQAESYGGSALHPLVSYPERFVARTANAAIRGRLKIGTKNVFFDSDDWRDPVIRISLASIERASPCRDSSRSHSSSDGLGRDVSAADEENAENSVLILASGAVFQRELGNDHPYVHVQIKGRHMFTPLYTSSLQLLEEINSLIHITASSSRRTCSERLRALVQEREARVPFDITLLEHGETENAIMDSAACAVYAMATAPGRFRVTSDNLYFMPIHGESSQAVERIPARQIRSIRRLRHGCLDAALELGFVELTDQKDSARSASFMVSFQSHKIREKAIETLLGVVGDDVCIFDRRELEEALNKWRQGKMSNFDYLMYLNMASGRSFNDLSQYPVFPWVLKDYESDELDLDNPSTFRDLSRPIGALEPERLAVLSARYQDMPPPRFLYGTHYSTPAYTINYLVRAAPAAMLRLQNGRFDNPDRLFHSILGTWRGVLANQGDVKELIPEFYATDYAKGFCSGVLGSTASPGQFLDNVRGLNLGIRQDGKRVDDVELPPWANGSSELFVRRNREALESPYVSTRLHSWIDLIFGVKSGSADAKNVFYTDVALPNAVEAADMSRMTSEEILQLETVYLEFGRTPQRLFSYPHPPRFGDLGITDNLMDERGLIHSPGQSPERRINNEQKGDGTPKTSPERKTKNSSHEAEETGEGDSGRDLSDRLTSWGARSRRCNSVLAGASEHVLVSYEPLQPSNDETKACVVSIPSLSHIISPIAKRDSTSEILDICLVEEISGQGTELSQGQSNEPVLCTVWRDGHLRVHSETKTLRTKHVGDVCSVAYISPGMVVYGTLNGSICLYHINTGRIDIVESAAHDAEVHALEYKEQLNILISGSKDASIKLWHVEKQSHSELSLQLIQELDAESSVDDLSSFVETVTSTKSGPKDTLLLLVATATADNQLMAWQVDFKGKRDDFPQPVWRCECTLNGPGISTRRNRTITWLYQGVSRRPTLASIHSEENCLRIWSLDEMTMASAEVFLPNGCANAITQSAAARTLLVGGEAGQISEFDSTGLSMGSITTNAGNVGCILVPEHGKCFYVLVGSDEVLRFNR